MLYEIQLALIFVRNNSADHRPKPGEPTDLGASTLKNDAAFALIIDFVILYERVILIRAIHVPAYGPRALSNILSELKNCCTVTRLASKWSLTSGAPVLWEKKPAGCRHDCASQEPQNRQEQAQHTKSQVHQTRPRPPQTQHQRLSHTLTVNHSLSPALPLWPDEISFPHLKSFYQPQRRSSSYLSQAAQALHTFLFCVALRDRPKPFYTCLMTSKATGHGCPSSVTLARI